jgi:mycothiol synthase
MEWGPLTRHDVQPLAELWAATEAADRTGVIYAPGDVAEQLAHPLIDLSAGTLAARDGERIVAVGYLPVRPSAGEAHLMRMWGGVHPDYRRRGLGRQILDWAVRTAPELSAKVFPGLPLELQLDVFDGQAGLVPLAEASGFAPVRWFARMERSLSGDLPAIRTPDGLSVVTWTPELNEGARHVRNASFLDHWGSVSHTSESWMSFTTGSRNFRPDASFVALAGDRAVGVLITHFFDAKSARLGDRQAWIQIIGTLKEWRGKGVASALIAHALTAFASQGYESAGLGVDADNPSGAVGVYSRAGFEITERSTCYARRITPA